MKIAIVQFYSYHEEVLAPQIDFLLPDNELYIAAPENVLQNDYIAFYKNHFKKIGFPNKRYDTFVSRVFAILLKYIVLFQAHKKYHFNLIIFNTINKRFHFFLINIFFSNVDKVHIIHNAQFFLSRKNIKPLHCFKKNLFISIDVYTNYIEEMSDKINASDFDWFSPLLSYKIAENSNDRSISTDKITIVIPGSVDTKRRNYAGLFNALKDIPIQTAPFIIILLGKIAPDTQKQIDELGLGNLVKTFTEYVPGNDMLHVVNHADAVAFLIDSGIGDTFGLYNKYKASGNSNLCFSSGTPCIVSDDFNLDRGLREKALFYPGNHIEYVFRDIMNGKLTKEQFARLKMLSLPPEYDHRYQRDHYRKIMGVI